MADEENDSFFHYKRHPEESLKLARSICAEEKLSRPVSIMEGGSQLLYSLGADLVCKVFHPDEGSYCANEALFLDKLSGRLPIATPRLHLSGSLEGYPYLIMDAMKGQPLVRIWPTLSERDRGDIMGQLGRSVQVLHSLPVELFASADAEWHEFIDQQQAHLESHHRKSGLDERWISDILTYVQTAEWDLHDVSSLVPLHTELMLEHLFVEQERDDSWVLSGLIDFEPSMVGFRDYEFCSVGIFLSQGNRDLFRLFLMSYNREEKELSEGLGQRVMKLMLLHRYSNLPWFMRFIPDHVAATTCMQLERYWFSC